MAKNVLTPRQDLLTREFYVEVAERVEHMLPDSPAYGRQLRAILLLLLNYDRIKSGAFIEKGQSVQIEFGSNDYSAYPDEWAADYDAAVAAIAIGEGNEEDYGTDTSEASASEQAEDSALREAVLSEDV